MKIPRNVFFILLILSSSVLHAVENPQATPLTKNLYNNLKQIAGHSLIYGQHHAYFLGSEANDVDYSSCKFITGENPGLVGYDFVRTGQWSPTGESNFKTQSILHFLRGGINTYSWHAKNPSPTASSPNSNDGNPVQGILTPGSQTRANWNAKLDDVCAFFQNLTVDVDGDGTDELVPIIWRPFHEQFHSAFWWGKNYCTPQEYKDLWIYTYDYMVNVKGVNNLIWAHSPNKRTTIPDYLERYPGDEYVDIFGFDYYEDFDSSGPESDLLECARVVGQLAQERGKVAACTETGEKNGFGNSIRTDFFTEIWLDNFQNDSQGYAQLLAYVMTWSADDWAAFPAPGVNNHLHADFIAFYNSPYTVFEDGMPGFLYDDIHEWEYSYHEAEDANLTGVEVGTNVAGYFGTGHTKRNTFNNTGDKIEFAVNVPDTNDYQVSFRYNSVADKPNDIKINGSDFGSAAFANTNSSWALQELGEVLLNAGSNTISIEKAFGWIDVDYLELGSPKINFSYQYEAESATLTGVSTGTNRAGYSGSGHTTRNSFTTSGDTIEFSVYIPAAGNYLLAIRYNCASNQKNHIDVNGINLGNPTFTDTNDTWQTLDFGAVSLNAGPNTITIREAWGWIDVDYIQLSSQ